MPRVKSKVARHKRRKRVLKEAKGYVGGRSKLYRTAKETVMRAKAFATAHRRKRKGDFRRLWITRLTAACRAADLTYSQFIKALKDANIELDRKIMADLAMDDPDTFAKLVEIAKQQLGLLSRNARPKAGDAKT
jgi:large subunit ribosomal protein L20